MTNNTAPAHPHRPSDQFILHDPRTAELLNNRPLLLTPTKYTTGLCLPHLFLWQPLPTRIDQPTIYPSLPHPRQTTTITSAVPNGRLHISLRLGSSWPRRALTTSITPNNEQLDLRCLLVLLQCALDLYLLPVFLRPPHHLQRLLLLVCHPHGWDSRWQPLRNSIHVQGRRVLTRHHPNDMPLDSWNKNMVWPRIGTAMVHALQFGLVNQTLPPSPAEDLLNHLG
jgi:hypothetical protein